MTVMVTCTWRVAVNSQRLSTLINCWFKSCTPTHPIFAGQRPESFLIERLIVGEGQTAVDTSLNDLRTASRDSIA
jgi:hypothetical protein